MALYIELEIDEVKWFTGLIYTFILKRECGVFCSAISKTKVYPLLPATSSPFHVRPGILIQDP
jgi:hypothetical protein